MKYFNYKQIARIVLKSDDAINTQIVNQTDFYKLDTIPMSSFTGTFNATTGDIALTPSPQNIADPEYDNTNINNINIIGNYSFKIDLPTINFNNNVNTNLKVAVESFRLVNNIEYDYGLKDKANIGDVYLRNIYDNSVYHSSTISKTMGLPLLSHNLGKKYNEYINNDLITNSYDIPNNVRWLNNNEILNIFVDTKIKDINDVDIVGCPSNSKWVLTLIIYQYEKEENEKIENNGKFAYSTPRMRSDVF